MRQVALGRSRYPTRFFLSFMIRLKIMRWAMALSAGTVLWLPDLAGAASPTTTAQLQADWLRQEQVRVAPETVTNGPMTPA